MSDIRLSGVNRLSNGGYIVYILKDDVPIGYSSGTTPTKAKSNAEKRKKIVERELNDDSIN